MAMMLEGLILSVVKQMVGTLSLVVLSLLDVLHLVINKSLGEVAALSLRGLQTMVFLSWHSCSSNETGVVFPWWFQV
jgi:hypothetical protein